MRRSVAWILILLVPLAGPAGASHAKPDFAIEDSAGDVQTQPAGTEALFPIGPLDLRRLALLDENEAFLTFELRVHDIPTAATGPPQNSLSTSIAYAVDFAAPEASYQARLELVGWRSTSDPPSVFNAVRARLSNFCFLNRPGCSFESLPAVMDDEANTVRFYIPRPWLLGDFRHGPPSSNPVADVGPGTVLDGFSVSSSYTSPFFPAYARDEMRDDAPGYALQHVNANRELKLKIPAFALYYAPGTNHSFSFTLDNAHGPRRLVRLSYETVAAGEGTPELQVFGPGLVSIPAGQSRNYTFAVLSKGPNPPAQLRIRAESVGFPAVGFVMVGLENGTVLGPDRNTLRFHSTGRDSQQHPECRLFNACYPWLRLHPDASVQGLRSRGAVSAFGTTSAMVMPMVAAPMVLREGGAVQVDLRLATDALPVEGRVEAQLRYFFGGSAVQMVTGTQEVTVVPEGVTATFRGVPRTKEPLLPAGGTFVLDFYVRRSNPVFSYTNAPIHLILEESSVRLPLADVPAEYLTLAVPSPFQTSVVGERDEFVNPGKARLFNVSVTNIDATEQRARVTVDASAPWRVEVLPGTEFVLPPAQSVTLGVLLHAPAESVESDRNVVRVNVTSDQGARAGVRLTATVVKAIEIGDDAGRFKASAEDEALVVKPPRPSPGAGVMAVLVLGLWAALRRRP